MKTVTINVPLPMTPDELAQQRAEAQRLEEEHQRKVCSQNNRKAGHPEPKAGGSLFVTTARGLTARARAGLTFQTIPTEVKIVDMDDKELRQKQVAGASMVSVDGAELILADSNSDHGGLTVFQSKNDVASGAFADKTDDELEAEVARRKAAKREGSPDRIGSTRKAALDGATTDGTRGVTGDTKSGETKKH